MELNKKLAALREQMRQWKKLPAELDGVDRGLAVLEEKGQKLEEI